MPLFSGQAVHFRGLAGSTFVCLAVALVAYVIGFASNSWLVEGGLGVTRHQGLWQSCTCTGQDSKPDWFRGVQVLITAGLVGLLVAVIVIFIYMCVPSASKKRTLVVLAVVCFVSAGLMVAGIMLLALKSTASDISWSFCVAALAALFCLLAGLCAAILASSLGVIVQAKIFGISI